MRGMVCTLVALLIAASSCGAALGEAVRQDSVLAWDDGEIDEFYHTIGGRPWTRLAVRFAAPPWCRSVTGVSYYITQHMGCWPGNGPPETAYPFWVCLWKPRPFDTSRPGSTATRPILTEGDHPLEAWLHVEFPEPVALDDAESFPGGVFFVGLEWEFTISPQIGLDHSSPVAGMSAFNDLNIFERTRDCPLIGCPAPPRRWQLAR